VEIIEIWRKAQTLDRAFDVRLDVLGGVGDGAVFESGETAFGGDYEGDQLESLFEIVAYVYVRKILSRTLCFLMKSPRSFSLTPAWYTT
jgi:hypothetical protein